MLRKTWFICLPLRLFGSKEYKHSLPKCLFANASVWWSMTSLIVGSVGGAVVSKLTNYVIVRMGHFNASYTRTKWAFFKNFNSNIETTMRVFPGLNQKYYEPWYVVLFWSEIVKIMVVLRTMVFTILLHKNTTYHGT